MNQDIKQRIDQIKKGEIPTGYKKTNIGIYPINWRLTKVGLISSHVVEKNINSNFKITFTNSATKGVIKQSDFFEKEISNVENIAKYYVVQENDYIYNPRTSVSAPYGPINKSHFAEKGIVSPLYIVFRMDKDLEKNKYIENFFISSLWHRYVYQIANNGARHDRMNITINEFFDMPVPIPPTKEQQKIAEILMQCDKVIELYEQEIDELKSLKKAYLRKMFPQNGKNVPELRFAGFTDPWEQRKLKEFSKYVPSTLTVKDIDENGKYDLYDANNWIGKIDKPLLDNDYISIIKDGAGVGRVRKLSKNTSILGTMGAIIPQNSDYNFLFYTLEKTDFTKLTSGGTIPHIYFNQYGEEKFFIPSIFEQQVVGQYFVNLDNLITLHERKVEEQKNQKKSLMQLLLTGIVRVKSSK